MLLLAAPGMLALLLEPAAWLVRTWTDPSYASQGIWIALFCLALAGRSILSGSVASDPIDRRRALWLLVATALGRLAGRLLAVNVIGAMALVFDVWAAGLLLGLHRRRWAVHPMALAVLFGFSLPLEHMLQRLLGYPLRLSATVVAETLLSPFVDGLTRTGTLLVSDRVALSIDLPCSGARGLLLLAALAVGFAGRRRPAWWGVLLAPVTVLAGALVANTSRILILFAGARLELPLLAEPWHSGVGLVCLALGALPVLVVTGRWTPRAPPPGSSVRSRRRIKPWLAAGFTLAALAVAFAPHRPIDVGEPIATSALPNGLGPWIGTPTPLSATESHYYATYGGHAEKRRYDGRDSSHTALVVRTTAPLRHLHGPDRCLLGAGHEVTRLGVTPGAIPTVVWRSVAPDGRAWRVEASFVSSAGESAAGISEVVWRWLHRPSTTWVLMERITPFQTCEERPDRCRSFDAALFAALDLQTHQELP